MNHKLINANSYHLGRHSSWHNFMDTAIKCAIGIIVISVLAVFVLIVTMPIWAH